MAGLSNDILLATPLCVCVPYTYTYIHGLVNCTVYSYIGIYILIGYQLFDSLRLKPFQNCSKTDTRCDVKFLSVWKYLVEVFVSCYVSKKS